MNAVSPVASSQKTTDDTGTLALATGAGVRVYTKRSEKKAPSQASVCLTVKDNPCQMRLVLETAAANRVLRFQA